MGLLPLLVVVAVMSFGTICGRAGEPDMGKGANGQKTRLVDLAKAPAILKEIWLDCLKQHEQTFSDSQVAYDDETKTLTISLGVRTFKIYRQLMNGEYSEELEPVQAPGANGFRISLSIRDGLYGGSAKLPQTFSKPYWKQYVDAISSNDKTQHLLISIHYGQKRQEIVLAVMKCVTEIAGKAGGFGNLSKRE